MGLFDLNREAVVVKEPFMGSNLYYIDNFYKNPRDVVHMFKTTPSESHDPYKLISGETFNGVHFDDRRHHFQNEEIIPVYDHLSEICNQKPMISGSVSGSDTYYNTASVLTNQIKFVKNNFNNYVDNYWHPHSDSGYNAIVFLNENENDMCGTNLYEKIKPDLPKSRGEHIDSWRSKEIWKLLTTLKPAFNRCVLFDGRKFFHGMHIPNELYFGDEYRMNQVFFFEGQDT